MITGKDLHGMTALSYATNSGVMEIIKIVSASMSGYLPAAQVQNLACSFSPLEQLVVGYYYYHCFGVNGLEFVASLFLAPPHGKKNTLYRLHV